MTKSTRHNLSFRGKLAGAFSSFRSGGRSASGERNLSSIFARGKAVTSLLALSVFSFALNAQAPTAVPVGKEPHHHLVLENEYVRAFRVSIPANDATLMHQHDLPYVFVSLGPADFINAVAGKPEAHATMVDGQIGYSRGGFAHIARTDKGVAFNNVTIELLKPQGDPHNRCMKIVASEPLGTCEKPDTDLSPKNSSELQFETAEMLVNLVHLDPGSNLATVSPQGASLIVPLNSSEVQIELAGKSKKKLRGGEVFWMDGQSPEVVSNPGKQIVGYLELTFKDSSKSGKP